MSSKPQLGVAIISKRGVIRLASTVLTSKSIKSIRCLSFVKPRAIAKYSADPPALFKARVSKLGHSSKRPATSSITSTGLSLSYSVLNSAVSPDESLAFTSAPSSNSYLIYLTRVILHAQCSKVSPYSSHNALNKSGVINCNRYSKTENCLLDNALWTIIKYLALVIGFQP